MKRIETLEFLADHAKQATAILSAKPYTRAGDSLPEGVQKLCDLVERQSAILADIRNKIEQETTPGEWTAYIYEQVKSVVE